MAWKMIGTLISAHALGLTMPLPVQASAYPLSFSNLERALRDGMLTNLDSMQVTSPTSSLGNTLSSWVRELPSSRRNRADLSCFENVVSHDIQLLSSSALELSSRQPPLPRHLSLEVSYMPGHIQNCVKSSYSTA